MNLGHAHKTRFWYLLGVFSKFSDEHCSRFELGSLYFSDPSTEFDFDFFRFFLRRFLGLNVFAPPKF